jgi:phage tail-like protein
MLEDMFNVKREGGLMALGGRKDPYLGFRFLVEIEGLIAGGFSEVSGLVTEVETEDYREGGHNGYVHKLPKAPKYSNIVLKRGITDSDVLWRWSQDVLNGKFMRKNVSVVLLDNAGNEKWRWNFFRTYPVKWSGPEFKADGNAVALETLELVHEGLKKG